MTDDLADRVRHRASRRWPSLDADLSALLARPKTDAPALAVPVRGARAVRAGRWLVVARGRRGLDLSPLRLEGGCA